ncbi:MAG: hypothetical protein IPG45_34260 [Deltaproteobacteria bacterium]|nr:hypothetical protein [Deltaproteobacteria bacterium]
MERITHRGQEVQFGGEKEYRLQKLEAGSKLEPTTPAAWEPKLLRNLSADLFKAGEVKPAEQLAWSDLNDKGKAQYALAYKAAHGDFPVIRVAPNPDYAKITWENNGWIEVVSNPFDAAGLNKFLKNYGWGHVHTSFMRGAPPPEQKQILFWVGMANVWSFLNSLEERGASGNGEDAWRFDVKGLSLPTEEHLDRWAQVLGGKNKVATAFSKHCIINIRGNGKQYGHPDRIGMETRGGQTEEKRRMLDSLINGLQNGHWGAQPIERGANGFRLVRLGADLTHDKKGSALQPSSLPSDFKTLVKENLQRKPVEGLTAADADRLYDFMKAATLGKGHVEARIGRFDQRGCLPLLNYEALPWLSDEDRDRVNKARSKFLLGLSDLQKAGGANSGTAIAKLIATWAKEAKLAESIGRWLDGPAGRIQVIGREEEAPAKAAAPAEPATAVDHPAEVEAPPAVAAQAEVVSEAPVVARAEPVSVPPEAVAMEVEEVRLEAPAEALLGEVLPPLDLGPATSSVDRARPVEASLFAPASLGARRTAAEWAKALEGAAADPNKFDQTLRSLEQELSTDRELAQRLSEHDAQLQGRLKRLAPLRTSRVGRLLFGTAQERELAAVGTNRVKADTTQRQELLRDKAATMLKAKLPKALWGYLELDQDLAGANKSPRLLRKVEEGVQFKGYEKFGSVQGSAQQREVYTFFVRSNRADQEKVPGPKWDLPGFHGTYFAAEGHFRIHQYQHLNLPRGTAAEVIADQLRLVAQPTDLKKLSLGDISNGATLDAFVRFTASGERELRPDPAFANTPLHLTLSKALASMGLRIAEVVPKLKQDFLGARLSLELRLAPKDAP